MKRGHLPLVGYLTLRRCSRETTKFGRIPSKAPIREIAKVRRNPAFQRLAFGAGGTIGRFHRLQLCQQCVDPVIAPILRRQFRQAHQDPRSG
jgi:hypothetical protein